MCLSSIISKSQSGFVLGRQITDNILIAYEIMHFLKRKNKGKRGFMSIKVGHEQTYDIVEWDYLEQVLTVLGFPQRLTSLIMQCVRITSFLVSELLLS